MATQRMMRVLLAVVLLAFLIASAVPAMAAEEGLFGPTTYTRTSGPPNQFSETIALPPTLTAPFRLQVQNGNPDGTNRVSSATITLNGTAVVTPTDFNQQVAAFDKAVTLQPSNTFQVRLTSLPGSFLILSLYASIPPPTLTSLLPPSLPITAGGTGTLTATISAVQSTETIITLASSDPAVVTVPASVPVPASAVSVSVPVTALAPGTATITASLNGSSLQSSVTVSPAGPTLTGLTPPSLQITQGASGILTLTLSAAQATDTEVLLTASPASVLGLLSSVSCPRSPCPQGRLPRPSPSSAMPLAQPP